MNSSVLMPNGEKNVQPLPKVKSVRPFGSKILVEVLNGDEILGTNLHIGKTELNGAPQAYIIDIGPGLKEDSGLKPGQRIYWTGKGTEVKDPNTASHRIRALLEVSNILAIIEES